MGRCAVRLIRALVEELGRALCVFVLTVQLLGLAVGLVERCAAVRSCGRFDVVAVWLVAPVDGSEAPQFFDLVERVARSFNFFAVAVR